MKMCLKLVYCAFSSSPSEDATKSTFVVFLLHYLLKFKPSDEFFLFQNVIANLSVFMARVCVCVHPFDKDVCQAIIGNLYQCHFQKKVGWVAFTVSVLFTLKIKSFQM